MSKINLRCMNCGEVFFSGFDIGGRAVMVGNRSRCPHCGSLEQVPDGLYHVVQKVVDVVTVDSFNVGSNAQCLKEAFEHAKGANGSLDAVLSKIDKQSLRERLWKALKPLWPNTRGERYQLIGLVIRLLEKLKDSFFVG